MKKFAVAFLSILFFACADSEQEVTLIPVAAPVCDHSVTEFQQLYNQLATENSNQFAMENETHAYTFEVTTPRHICSIGYQSQPEIATVPYRIEIYNNTTGTILYTDSRTFSPSATSYISVGSLPVNPGNSYTVRRIQEYWQPVISNAVGRVVTKTNGNFSFPIISGDLEITGASFDGFESTNAIPFIDLVFEN